MNDVSITFDDASHLNRRFGGIARLYGDEALHRFENAHLCVIGVGGVGSWLVESLARSAIGTITMIDMDIVAESNINRQLPAVSATLGRDKIEVMRERVEGINPRCKVNLVDEFLSRENLAELVRPEYDFVIDCIDDFRTKAALIAHCKRHKIDIITIGGAGGQKDPGKIRQCDLSRTQHDVLLARTRKLLRQDYSFARNPQRSFGIPCVYSDEQLLYPDGEGGLSPRRPAGESDAGGANALNCAGGIGSVTHVTASFAFFACAYVLDKLANAA